MTNDDVRELTIEDLGAHGDGVVHPGSGEPVFVAGALPGERVQVGLEGNRGRLVEVLKASQNRIVPVCPHFGTCGGCALQHLETAHYLLWKRDKVVQAFAARGIEADVADVFSVGPGARRRAILSARAAGNGVHLGFYAAGSHDLVDVSVCPVLSERLSGLLPGLRDLLVPIVRGANTAVRVTLLEAENGIDVDVGDAGKGLDADALSRLSRLAADLSIVRLSLDGDPVLQSEPPVVKIPPAKIAVPPGVFMQASAVAEARIVALIEEALSGKRRPKRVVDLFCGVGAFTFPVARRAQVTAFDNAPDAIHALRAGVRSTQGVKRIEAKVRDLFSEPLSRRELDDFDAIIFDPPRAGAKEQALAIARSKVDRVIAVSCNPATLARDARILLDGGYRLEAVSPIDQFMFSAHVEAVAVFRR